MYVEGERQKKRERKSKRDKRQCKREREHCKESSVKTEQKESKYISAKEKKDSDGVKSEPSCAAVSQELRLVAVPQQQTTVKPRFAGNPPDPCEPEQHRPVLKGNPELTRINSLRNGGPASSAPRSRRKATDEAEILVEVSLIGRARRAFHRPEIVRENDRECDKGDQDKAAQRVW